MKILAWFSAGIVAVAAAAACGPSQLGIPVQNGGSGGAGATGTTGTTATTGTVTSTGGSSSSHATATSSSTVGATSTSTSSGATCVFEGEPCTAGECCTGTTCTGGLCEPTCGAVGASCTVPTECCSGNCCSGQCAASICPTCGQEGASCTAGSDCCGGFCCGDQCSSTACCSQTGATCTSGSDCCGGFCCADQCSSTACPACVPTDTCADVLNGDASASDLCGTELADWEAVYQCLCGTSGLCYADCASNYCTGAAVTSACSTCEENDCLNDLLTCAGE